MATLTVVTAACVAVPVSSSSASTWTLAQASPPTGGWTSVNFLHGQWIALDDAGEVAVSHDGASWTEQPAPMGSWRVVAYGAGRYVALSSANAVRNEMISTNGVQWSTLTGPPGTPRQANHPSLNGQWTGIAYGDGRFAAVSSVGTVATSINGATWTRLFWRPQDSFTSITFGDGRFIAVDATEGDVLLSLNGNRWSLIRRTHRRGHCSNRRAAPRRRRLRQRQLRRVG